jgi:caffeoyl-CoA O-methyltransferase
MPDKFISMTPELNRYVLEHGARDDELLERLSAETEGLGEIAIMQTAPEQAALITLLVRAMGARKALELGTFTGYGAIAIARGLPDDGLLVTCDVSEEWTAIARRYIREAGLEDRVDIRLGPGLDTLRAIPEDGSFDFAFIDADKPGYGDYYEEVLRLLRPGGLAMLDNVLFSGAVLDPEPGSSAEALDQVNRTIAADERVDIAMLGFADGVTLVRKR